MATDYGTDISTFGSWSDVPDMDPSFAVISGPRAVAECLARGLAMPRGRLVDINDDQHVGFDIRRFISARMTEAVFAQIRQGVRSEALSDERVASVDVVLEWNEFTERLKVQASGTTTTGQTFDLVLSVGKVTFDLLSAT